jgi:hypothetical protein
MAFAAALAIGWLAARIHRRMKSRSRFAHPVSITLLNHETSDGSRQFAALPETKSWSELRQHLSRLAGVQVTDFVTDGVTEAWIDFTYRGHAFTVNNQFGEFWFFVTDPSCADEILKEVVTHCQRLL